MNIKQPFFKALIYFLIIIGSANCETEQKEQENTSEAFQKKVMSIEMQWNDLKEKILIQDIEGINAFCDFQDKQSVINFAYLDFSDPNFSSEFDKHKAYEDLNESEIEDDEKVMTLFFCYKLEGKSMDSAVIFYFQIIDYSIRIVRCELAV